MIDWCNANQGFIMVVLTLVYVIATIATSTGTRSMKL